MLVFAALASTSFATTTLCAPPVDDACDPLMNPAIADCNPFTLTLDNTDVAGIWSADPTYATWTCRTACVITTDWETDCSYTAKDTAGTAETYDRWDDTSAALVTGTARRVSMVVNNIGVTLEYTDDGYDDGPVVILHAGGGSNTAFNAGEPIRDYLRAYSNARTVAVKYELGVDLLEGAGSVPDGGWHLRDSSAASNYVVQTQRTADVISWVSDELRNPSQPLGTVACSMGALATMAAPVWHGLDAIIDYQAMIGGPPMWDVNAGCGRLGATYLDPPDPGIIGNEEYGGVQLATGEFCNTSDDHCLTYWPVQSKLFKNHVHLLDPTHAGDVCLNSADAPWPATDDPLSTFEASSFATVASPDWSLSHTVDFFVDRTLSPGGTCDGTTCPDSPFFSTGFVSAVTSDETKAGPSTVRVYQALQPDTTVSWTWQEGGHCDSLTTDANTPPVRDAVVRGLEVEAARHELRVVKHEDNFTATDACLVYDAGAGENTFSDSEVVYANGRGYRAGTYHDASGSPELQATIANSTTYTLPTNAKVDRVRMLISGSTGGSPAGLQVTFTYADSGGSESVTAPIPLDDTTVGTWSGTDWQVAAWSGAVTGNGPGLGCGDGAFEVMIRNPRPSLFGTVSTLYVESITVNYGTILGGPLAVTIMTDHATWDAVETANSVSGCDVTAPFTSACEFEPVLTYWN